jgi:hypothetical protein
MSDDGKAEAPKKEFSWMPAGREPLAGTKLLTNHMFILFNFTVQMGNMTP